MPEVNAEVVIYDLRKWLRLTVAVNPNVVETLLVGDDHPCAIVSTAAWRYVRSETLPLLNQQAARRVSRLRDEPAQKDGGQAVEQDRPAGDRRGVRL